MVRGCVRDGGRVLFVHPRPGFAADDVAAGEALYQSKCTGCHSVDADRIGPRHRNVVGA
jgi:cytochrome c